MTDLDLRRGGCSDLGALAGVDKYRGPFSLYNRIAHGILPTVPERLAELGELGSEGERATARVACRRHLRRDPDLLFKPDSQLLGDHLRYSLDFVQGLDAEGEVRAPDQVLIEVKRRSEFELDRAWGPPGTDQIPEDVWCQVQGQLEAVRRDRDFWQGTVVPELEEVTVAVEVWPRGIQIYRVPRHPAVGAQLLDDLERFVRDSRQGIVPPAAAADRDLAVELAAKAVVAGPRDATPQEEDLFRRRHELKTELDRLELEHKAVEALLAQSIAASGAEAIRIGGGRMRCYERRGFPGWKQAAIELGAQLKLSEAEVLAKAETHRGKPSAVLGWWATTKP